MQFLADENIDRPIVEWLRERGHDVLWVAEDAPGVPDENVLSESTLADRVLLTFDLDFGELVFRQRIPTPGIILLRLRSRSVEELLRRLRETWHEIEANAEGNFTVLTASQVRVRPLH